MVSRVPGGGDRELIHRKRKVGEGRREERWI
jgi:hypothetical protein